MTESLTREMLEAAEAWDPEDLAPARMTAFRQRLRYHQAQWRELHGHPIGTQPILPRRDQPARLVGSRLPLDYAHETGANCGAACPTTAAAKDSVFTAYPTR